MEAENNPKEDKEVNYAFNGPEVVADFFLSKEELSPKKIQKLVYYSYAWFLATNNDTVESGDAITNKLFKETPEAWLHGPVFRSLYEKYKTYGWRKVEKGKAPKIDNKDIVEFLEKIWATFGEYSADALEYMTHQETPWINARREEKSLQSTNNKISDLDIYVFYNSLLEKESQIA